MTKNDPKNILRRNLDAMREQWKLNEQAESEVDDNNDSSNISGPKNELEYQRMKKDIKDSHNEK
ncbi:hypothetical protein [Sessilibacter corallicola]|uniref:Uncharacterized protein n=1 Tax=Sessilibacter corallicola TaxID=2904075 RepID=A0ABQ0A7D8_9GAMM